MRKILYIVLVCSALSAISCSKEALNTSPSGSLTPGQVFENSEAAQSAVDGIYRLMYTNGWCGYDSEHPGLAGFTMAHSLMGEDHLQYAQGSGWFYYDYAFLISQDWTATYGRQHGTWNMFYTFISLANYVIDHEAMLSADATGNDVLGQAYAIRAFSYYCLYESFCQGNYTENKTAPGVPIYTKGTDKNTGGVGRGTVEGLFTQINTDFQKSVDFFKTGTGVQSHLSHIDIYTAYGLWARAALAQQDYGNAKTCAEEALKKPGLDRVASLSALGGFNNRNVSDVLWAFQLTTDQVGDSYFYWQTKFTYQDPTTGVADIINLRAEELLLTLAECLVREDSDYTGAREWEGCLT